MTEIFDSRCWLAPLLLLSGVLAHGHGSVTMEDDLCAIEIGFYSAHFAIYQPQTRQHTEYCEDIPDATESVFVIDYLHDVMREVPVDFRIIRDRENRGRFVRWEDIEAIDDLESETVFYQPPVVRPDAVFLVNYQFVEEGDYIGIVTAPHPTLDKTYAAVFPFKVGATSWGYTPWFILIVVLLQLIYWLMSGGFTRWRTRRRAAKPCESAA